MSFAADLRRFTVKLPPTVQAVVAGVGAEAQASIKGDGAPHPITGAPGQPVDRGNLRNSWVLEVRPGEAEVSTNVVYAPGIEDGVDLRTGRPLTLRSPVGGFHSVAMTIAGADALLRDVVRRLVR